jgi:hypothetical protein
MSSYLSDNDDDLFDYDPTVEPSDTFTPNDVSSSSSVDSDHHRYSKDFIEEVKNNFRDNADADLLVSQGCISLPISSLYSSFQEAIHAFINSVRHDYFAKTVHLTLDHLTNGHFSMVNLFHRYEMRIVRKIALVELFNQTIAKSDEETISPLLNQLSSLLNIDLTKLYYNSTFVSTINILNHTLTVDRVIYRFLATKTGIDVNPLLMQGLDLENNSSVEALMRSVDLSGFRQQIQDQMFNAFFAAEPNGQTPTLNEMLSEVFNTQSSYMSTFKTM